MPCRVTHRCLTVTVATLGVVLIILYVLILAKFMKEDCAIIDYKNTSYVITRGNMMKGSRQEHPPRVFCLILTTPSGWQSKGLAVKETWAKRCDGYCFFYSSQSQTIHSPDTCKLKTPEGKRHLTGKVLEALTYAKKNYADQFDWYLKADDDTYIIMENLKTMLAMFDPSEDHYLGYRHVHECKRVSHGHNSGGSGYVLSRPTTARLTAPGRLTNPNCRQDGEVEDLEIAECLASYHIYPENTLDEHGSPTFIPEPVSPDIYKKTKRFQSYKIQNFKEVRQLVSPRLVSLHHVSPVTLMYMFDFFLYDIKRPEHKQSTR